MPPSGKHRPDSESPRRRRLDDPQRSLVAPVKGENAPAVADEIVDLLKGAGSKAAAAALASAATLQKLPAVQQLALKKALIAASHEHEKVALVQFELAQTKSRLEREEKEWGEESRALARKSAQAEAEVASLKANLAEAMARNRALKSRFRVRGWYLLLILTSGLCAATLCAFLLPRQGTRPPPEISRSRKMTSPRAPVVPTSPKGPPAPPEAIDAPEVLALDRLSRALGGIPLSAADNILSEANAWLEAKGALPCTMHFAEGKPALVVGGNDKTGAPLLQAIVRCAEAVEHVIP